MDTSNLRASLLVLAAAICAAGLPGVTLGSEIEDMAAQSKTDIGVNPLLSQGATAILKGDYQRGVDLTQAGLGFAVTREDKAAALANICAGYAAMRQYRQGLEYCNRSLQLSEANWRTWQNRAACYLGLGKIEESLRDIQRGLRLNPDADALQKTLALAREYEKRQQERMRHLLES